VLDRWKDHGQSVARYVALGEELKNAAKGRAA
jgi:hypothetical protein